MQTWTERQQEIGGPDRARDFVLREITYKFGRVPDDVVARVRQMEDDGALFRLLLRAANVASLEEIIPKPITSSHMWHKRSRHPMRTWTERQQEIGYQRGYLKAARARLIRVLEIRFGTVSAAVRDRICRIDDGDMLSRLAVWATATPGIEHADLLRAFIHQLVRGGATTMTEDQGTGVASGADAYHHLRVTRRGATAFVTLARPEVRNAFNAALIAELHAAFTRLAADDDLRAVVLAGEGRTFCAGADLTWMRDSLDFTHEENVADARRMAAMFQAIEDCPCPVIGRIQGAALGGGAGLAAVCDLVIAAEDAKFGFTEARLGIAPATIAPFAVRKIGESHARALFTTAARFDAARALQIGLVHRVVPANVLDAAVDETLADLGQNSPAAVRAAKRMARQVGHLATDEALRLTTETIAGLRVSPEGQEGIRAFLEKRTAAWVTDDV